MTALSDLLAPAALGFVRVAAVSPELRVADVRFNAGVISAALRQAAAQGCRLAVFPELCITGYTCADLFYQSLLQAEARAALLELAAVADANGLAAVVGLPVEVGGRLFNCAAFLSGGRVAGLVPKTYLPTAGEYYEERWFAAAPRATAAAVPLGGQDVPFGTDLLFVASNQAHCAIGIEVCEDLWAVSPPSGGLALAGATLLVNPSASNELLGKADYRRELVKQQSARCLAGYLYAASGPGESTTDVVFSGHSIVAENGALLAEAERFQFATQMIVADLDVQRLANERLKNSSFSAAGGPSAIRRIPFALPAPATAAAAEAGAGLLRPLSPTPFVPSDLAQRARHCREIFSIQATGLARRLKHIGSRKVTLGISGGLDSTLALHAGLRHHGPHARQCAAHGGAAGRHAARDPHRRRGAPALQGHRP